MVGRRRHANAVLCFTAGAVSGCVLTLLLSSHLWLSKGNIGRLIPRLSDDQLLSDNAEDALDDGAEEDANENEDAEGDDDDAELRPLVKHRHSADEGALWKAMFEHVRVFCWIMTSHNNTYTKAVHVNATWASRCNKHVFITPEEDSDLPSVSLNISEGRNYLWAKTKEAFRYLYTHELENYEWFLKADDDTYVIMENLRFMLLGYSYEDPVYFGCKFKVYVKQGYMSGGAGYVLSREALRRFVEDALTDPHKCKEKPSGAEDVEMGKCLQNVGVAAGDSRDVRGRHRILPFGPLSHLTRNKTLPSWFYKYMYYPYEQGGECCSDYTISFHYVGPATMYELDFLIYHLRPFGLTMGDESSWMQLKDQKLIDYAKRKAVEHAHSIGEVVVVEPEAEELKRKHEKEKEQEE